MLCNHYPVHLYNFLVKHTANLLAKCRWQEKLSHQALVEGSISGAVGATGASVIWFTKNCTTEEESSVSS